MDHHHHQKNDFSVDDDDEEKKYFSCALCGEEEPKTADGACELECKHWLCEECSDWIDNLPNEIVVCPLCLKACHYEQNV